MSVRRYRRREPRRERDTFDEVAGVARSAYRIASKIKDVINIETKSYMSGQTAASPDPAALTATFNWSGMIPVIVNGMQLGDEDFQRIGDSIKVHRLKLLLRIEKPNTNDDSKNRLIVYWDEGNSATVASDVLYSSLLGTNIGFMSPKDWDKRHDTRIIYDKYLNQHSDTYNATTSYGYDQIFHVVDIPIGLHTQFEAGTQTIVTGALKFFLVSDATTNSTLSYQTMITYTDD